MVFKKTIPPHKHCESCGKAIDGEEKDICKECIEAQLNKQEE